jgi:UDP:flavonoid glycosyltransferase YjiC (YdhE family)
MAHDQLDNLSRVRDLGVGDGLAPKQFTPRRVARLLKRLAADSNVKARAAAISRRFDTEAWICQTCELIESTHRKDE